MRTTDVELVEKAVSRSTTPVTGVSIEEWLESSCNVALTDGNENIALFEWELPGVYSGHYFFLEHTRGKEAVRQSREFLDEFFSSQPDATLIKGLTPITHKGALWLSRHLGFTNHGTIRTPIGDCVLFILTRKEYADGRNSRR